MLDSLPRSVRRFRLLASGLAVASMASVAPAPAQTICLIAEVEQAQELPPSGSPAKGTACFTLDPVADTLRYEITIEGLLTGEVGAHLHGYAPAGMPGGILHVLPLGAQKSGVWNYPPADEAMILAGLTYVNIHTVGFGNGEIRGQVVRDVSNATLFNRIDGIQENPSNASPATGTACFSVDTSANTVTYQITYTASSLLGNESSAHIHGYAPLGMNGAIRHTLPGGFHKKGVWNYPQAQEASILAGLSYVNIHSTLFGNGEIRGQMLARCECNPSFLSYCTAGTSTSGCNAILAASGFPSATLPSGFTLSASGVEGDKTGIFFYGTNGQQANSWGNGTSFQCVTPPVKRGGLLNGTGTAGLCDGTFSQDLNARWCPACPKPSQNPGAGVTMQGQLWYRDPMNTSNQTTSLSDGMEWTVCP